MATAENAKIQIETGQTPVAYAVMTDSGDHKIHTISGGTIWSGKSGYTPNVRPNGIVSGRNILTTHASNDKVTIAAFTGYSKGVLKSVSATAAAITRAGTAARAQVHSVTMASDGSIAIVEGTISADQTFSETRDAAGGPPYIPANDVELGQVRVTTGTAAVIDADEIYQVVGTHTERYDYPLWSESNVGEGESAASAAKKNAFIEFASALPAIHTAAAYKQVFMSYYTPILSDQQRALDYTPVENSHTVSSTQYYRGTVGAVSSSIGQGGFTALLDDGTTDALVSEKDETLTVKFFPDENKTAYQLSQGKIGLTRSFPVDNQNQATITISAENVTAEFSS
jgi:hypothetical protein